MSLGGSWHPALSFHAICKEIWQSERHTEGQNLTACSNCGKQPRSVALAQKFFDCMPHWENQGCQGLVAARAVLRYSKTGTTCEHARFSC